MRHMNFYEIRKKLREHPEIVRKLKIFSIVGIMGFLMIGGMVVLAGVWVVNSVTLYTSRDIHPPIVRERLDNLNAEMREFVDVRALKCLDKAWSLVGISPWLEEAAVNNLIALKSVCLKEQKPVCKDQNCNSIN